MANRLSENPDWNVLLIEAGENPPIASAVRINNFNLILNLAITGSGTVI